MRTSRGYRSQGDHHPKREVLLGLKRGHMCLGDVTQKNSGESLGQRTLRASVAWDL
jgi:hypothetical protein